MRKQIYLTRKQERHLKTLAGRRRRPVADLIREALDGYLGLSRPTAGFARDPLWEIVGVARSTGVPGDEQDRVIYGLP